MVLASAIIPKSTASTTFDRLTSAVTSFNTGSAVSLLILLVVIIFNHFSIYFRSVYPPVNLLRRKGGLAHLIFGGVVNVWKGGGELTVHSSPEVPI